MNKNKVSLLGTFGVIGAVVNAQSVKILESDELYEAEGFNNHHWMSMGSGLTLKQSLKIDGKLPAKPIPTGHKKFIIEGETIWALNEKNARKKYNKSHKESQRIEHNPEYIIYPGQPDGC